MLSKIKIIILLIGITGSSFAMGDEPLVSYDDGVRITSRKEMLKQYENALEMSYISALAQIKKKNVTVEQIITDYYDAAFFLSYISSSSSNFENRDN